jgi:hypothetical protein
VTLLLLLLLLLVLLLPGRAGGRLMPKKAAKVESQLTVSARAIVGSERAVDGCLLLLLRVAAGAVRVGRAGDQGERRQGPRHQVLRRGALPVRPSGRLAASPRRCAVPRRASRRRHAFLQHDPDVGNGAGGQVIAVAFVPKAREIVYTDRKLGMECTHLVVPGMVVEKIQGRPLGSISFDMQAVAKYMNEYRFKNDGPLNLLFQEEVVDGQGKGFPYVIEVAEHNTRLHQAQAGRGRRGSILGKQRGAEVDQEVAMAQRHARRMSIDARKMSTSGPSALDDAAAAAAAHAKSMQMSSVDEGPKPAASASRSGRRGSIVSQGSSHDAAQNRSSIASSSMGGRRGSVSAMSMEEAARAAAATMMDSGDGGQRTPRAGGRRSSVSSASSHGGRRSSVHSQGSEDQTAELEASGVLTGTAYAVSFKSQGDGIRGEKVQLQVGRHTVALYEKNGQPHSHYKYKQFAQTNYVKTSDKGFIIRLASGRDLAFKAKPKEASQIAQEVTMAKLSWDDMHLREDEDEEEEEEPEDAHTDLMQLGARVMISGLVSEAGRRFNGMLGVVAKELDQSSGRLNVQLDNGKKTNIRPINVLPLVNGVKIQLTGLTSETGQQYNGKLARILDYDAGIGRYSVVMETGQSTRIRPINAGKVSDDSEVQRRLRKFEGRESDEDSSEDDYDNSGEEDDEADEDEELRWPDATILQWRRLACTFSSSPRSLGILWAESERKSHGIGRWVPARLGRRTHSRARALTPESHEMTF